MPGFLSSLLTIGGAIAGSFVGMPGVGASIGGAIGGAIDQSGASSTAAADQEAAQQQAIALRTAAANNIAGVQQPYTNLGISSANALTSRLGLGAPQIPIPTAPSGSVSVDANGQPISPGVSTAAPVTSAANTGVNALTGAALGAGAAIPNATTAPAPLGATTATTTASPTTIDPATGLPAMSTAIQPTTTIDPNTGQPATTSMLAPPTTGSPTGTAADPSAVATGAPNPAGVSATGASTDPGVFGNPANPTSPGTYSAPSPFSYTLADYQASPGYAYQQQQAAAATEASASATGALESGSAMKALQDRAQNIALGDFTQQQQFADQLYNQNTTNALNAYDTNYNAYNTDRNYLTGQFNTQTNNLFKGVSDGQTASGVVSNADLNVANGNATSATAGGAAAATNALTQGQIGSTAANGLVSPVTGLVTNGVNYLTGQPTTGGGANTDPTSNLTAAQVPNLNLSGNW